ncbi:hypothetical protein LZQ00_06145 [Sphingobacterium sp. SRCM116780]|uniref:hypothetical protein n=1 Tax=Sphingobacterium sp. SRCM116780 TaxID=2907623 RepID=UPI001F277B39|nr:hypothetical protein [Sphingobacterium sp. SRCM116780]UIR57395.1 hypothetical protein LZQ00_06145 [Sphingobacterium sp. SRCM116780]
MPWYPYNPTGTPPYSVTNPAFYGNPQANQPTCPSPDNFLCTIQANDSSGQPVITFALLEEITFALNNRTETTNVKLRPSVV